ncbi:hypothetical protein [Mesorhizobium sp. CO1-1-9]|uniref:hypothetical protein n=1 Tax=Mesorhizobium sp. CO1-1-9 TaxID=2876630 RepID=UPI001CCF02C5|nr:hypothetical protein [Mesorhizobium sp. CO1-1-9]MBZ9695496.1 hypothetical protein [Mesorhizobium sp. CO1-1-9]
MNHIVSRRAVVASTAAVVGLAVASIYPSNPLVAAERVSDELAMLIDNHREAYTALDQAAARQSNEQSREADRLFGEASEREDKAMLRLCGHRSLSMVDVTEKGRYLSEHANTNGLEDDQLDALLGSMAAPLHLASSARAPRTDQDDPALAAVAAFHAAQRKWMRLAYRLDAAEGSVFERFGHHRPSASVAWRGNSSLGLKGVEEFRVELLDNGFDPIVVEQEYADAKSRYRAAVHAGRDWDSKAGLTGLRDQMKAATRELDVAERQMARTRPTTVQGASRLMDCVMRDIVHGDAEWHHQALKTAAASLRNVSRGTHAVTS